MRYSFLSVVLVANCDGVFNDAVQQTEQMSSLRETFSSVL